MEIEQEPIKDELVDLDPVGIETEIKQLEHAEFLIMQQLYPIRHKKEQLKRDLSIARAKYWRSKG